MRVLFFIVFLTLAIYVTLISAIISTANATPQNKGISPIKTTTTIAHQNIPHPQHTLNHNVANLLPVQAIKNIDFRRGPKGEGHLLFALSALNTVVNIKEEGGKVVLNFMNTQLPQDLAKIYNVTDFATPVYQFTAQTKGTDVNVIITPHNSNFKYESYQSDNLLNVNFIPLSATQAQAKTQRQASGYNSDKLSLNFQSIPVKYALYMLADIVDFNIVLSDSVDGEITLRLNDVTLQQALDLILKSKGLTQRQEGNIILISPISEVIATEQQALESKKAQQILEPLHTEYIKIHYAKAEDILKVVNEQAGEVGDSNTSSDSSEVGGSVSPRFLSSRGVIYLDSRTRTIIIKDTAERIKEFKKMLAIIDVPIQQVMIEARIVTANTGFAQEIGVKFGVIKPATSADGKKEFSVDGANLVDLGASVINGTPVGVLGLTLARAADYVLNLELSALENDSKGQMLANPRVMTSDNELAYIKQGVRIPYVVSRSRGNNSDNETIEVEYIEATLKLEVTPKITPNGDVIMDLLINNDSPAVGTVLGQFTPVDKREIKTTVRVKDGETIVLGGVYEGDSSKDTYKIPFLSDLPIIGALFTKKAKTHKKTELLIFITPKIMKDTLTSM